MTTYTWTDDTMRSGTTCDVDKVADNLMHLKYNAGGLLQVNDLGTKTSNFTLDLNKIDLTNITASLTVSLPTTGFIGGVENKCILDFTTNSSSSPVISTTGITLHKKDGKLSAYSTLSGVRNRLIFTTIDSGSTWEVELQQYGGVETTFVQPVLSANGTLGGSSFAVYASNVQSGYDTYKASDNYYATGWAANVGVNPAYYILYNPITVKATSISIQNSVTGLGCPTNVTVFGSNDNSNYVTLASFTNSNYTVSSTWDIPISSLNQEFYNYYKLLFNGWYGGSALYMAQITINGYYVAV